MELNSCYLCDTPIPQLRVEGKDRFVFRCSHCGCETAPKLLLEAQEDWNEGHTFPPSCMKCEHGDGTYKPCGREIKNLHFLIMCPSYKKRGNPNDTSESTGTG